MIPSFELGSQPFDQFRLDFQLLADQSGFKAPIIGHAQYTELRDRKNYCVKGLFYQCLSTEAKALTGWRLYPTAGGCSAMSLKEYVEKLWLLFELNLKLLTKNSWQ